MSKIIAFLFIVFCSVPAFAVGSMHHHAEERRGNLLGEAQIAGASFQLVSLDKATDIHDASPLDTIHTEPTKAEPTKAELFNLDVLFRAALNADNFNQESARTRMNLDDIRLLLHGRYNEDLSYKVRFRLNRSFAPTALDNSSAALDYAYIDYKFGKHRNWSMTLGKQSAMVGSYEFENNPIYELIFTDYINHVVNLFVVGGKLSYAINPNQSFHVQLYNTVNNTLENHIQNNGFSKGDLKQAKVPMGAYFTWVGAFADRKIHTKWSYNIAQFAQGHTNHGIALANKYQTAKQMVYLDLNYTKQGVDHALLASQAINDFYAYTGGDRQLAQNVVYKSAIARYDQFITTKWELALKGGIESATHRDDETVGKNFRTNYTYFAAIQHKPFKKQDLRFYLGYIGNTVSFADRLAIGDKKFNRLALGGYFTIPVL
ncbi:porin [Sphingobacterium psychroaquaticum]|uniref:porin n=1 Tax=Sphingobacterium psychroaquaticum TaxID=561061 RepID=UPI001F116958|nr:porin [Sphingobacterium psychroaquaticum]